MGKGLQRTPRNKMDLKGGATMYEILLNVLLVAIILLVFVFTLALIDEIFPSFEYEISNLIEFIKGRKNK